MHNSFKRSENTLNSRDPRSQLTDKQDMSHQVKPNIEILYWVLDKSKSLYFHTAIYSGDTIALQTFVRNYWLGCSETSCGRYRCPVMMMSGNDWTGCASEVFKIYRASGTGAVRVGDLVGIYHPHESGHWLSCSSCNCGKNTCPGTPTTAHGFAAQEHWYTCWQSVFKIYAKGKNNSDIIDVYDDVSIYYLQDSLWVAQGYNHNTVKLPCLGTTRPPALNLYDHCAYETFTIWKR